MTMWIAVAIGAAIGAPLRAIIEQRTHAWSRAHGPAWQRLPTGLLVVNVLGSVLAGIVLATTTGTVQMLLLVGFCGAFTTFSGYAWHGYTTAGSSRPWFLAGLALMLAGCVGGFAVAFWACGQLVR